MITSKGNNSILSFFCKNNLMPVINYVIISCYIYPILSKTPSWLYFFKKEITFCALILVRQKGLSIHLISVAHCCPLVLIEDITHM